VLKPPEMRSKFSWEEKDSTTPRLGSEEDVYWPPPRPRLHRVTVEILSLHNLPKRGEVRPRLDGVHSECHKWRPELTGVNAPPTSLEPSNPTLIVSLHPVGGFCAVSEKLPLAQNVEAEAHLRENSAFNGMNVQLGSTVHCCAAEPHSTFFRVGVSDDGQEVAFETAVLGRFRLGYRVFQLRSSLGTRIELCYLFVQIAFGTEPNLWATPRELRIQSSMVEAQRAQLMETIQEQLQPHINKNAKLADENAKLSGEVNTLKRQNTMAESELAKLQKQVDALTKQQQGADTDDVSDV